MLPTRSSRPLVTTIGAAHQIAHQLALRLARPPARRVTRTALHATLGVATLLSLLACLGGDPAQGVGPSRPTDMSTDMSINKAVDDGVDSARDTDQGRDQSLDQGRDQGRDQDVDMVSSPDLGGDLGADMTSSATGWTWLPVPESVCGDGSPTGLGLNLSERSSDVLIFMQGGGACWDVTSCFVLKSAAHLESGYTASMFAREPTLRADPFDRQDPQNPFKDASFVFIPYCTGDLHAGDRVKRYEALGQTREVHHRGAANAQAFAQRLASRFPGPRRVWLTGSSAGGYGAQLNYARFAQVMPQATIHALSDCGPLVTPWGGRFAEMKSAWGLTPPQGCQGCDQALPAWLDHLTATYPERRFAMLAYEADRVIAVYFNYPLDGTFEGRVRRLMREQYDPHAQAHYFVSPGTEHVMLDRLRGLKAADGTALLDWVRAWAYGESSWRSVGPR